MSKKVLVIYYSQSGQLGDIIQNLTQPLIKAGNSVEICRVAPEKPYPFPWSGKSFFAVMPDCVLGATTDLQPILLQHNSYDLIILGYQAWFLSPSIPSNSILNHPLLSPIFKNTPVVTITGARNMWISAMEVIRKKLANLEAKHVGNIVLVDNHPNIVSFVTILYWMFTAKKDKYLGIFPKPGVADNDIKHCSVFGEIIAGYLNTGVYDGMQDTLLTKNSVEVKYNLMFIESKAKRIFTIWANIIAKKENKTPWLVAFKYYLIIALFVAAPIILTVDAIFFKPFLSARIKKQKEYFSGVN